MHMGVNRSRYRIDLLRERGQIVEALAWTCLKYEMNPGNVTAQALKERVKRRLKLTQPAGVTDVFRHR